MHQVSLIDTPDTGGSAEAFGDLCVSRDALAAVLDVKPDTINKYCTHGMPRRAHARYEVGECVRWLLEDMRQRLAKRAALGGSDTSERKRYDAARATRAELDLAVRQGEVIPVHEVSRAIMRLMAVTTGQLDALAARLAPAVAALDEPARCQERIHIETLAIREAISDAVSKYADEKPATKVRARRKTATKKKRGRVGRPKKNPT